MAAAAFLLVGCRLTGPVEVQDSDYPEVFTTTLENMPVSRTHIDGTMTQLWDANDAISVFRSTNNERYLFRSAGGSSSGLFSRDAANQLGIGDAIPRNYAIYPYSENYEYLGDDKIHIVLPAVQAYAPNSFASGCNPLIATTSDRLDNSLTFRNICGWLVVKIYGNTTVKSVSLKGNADEQIAGGVIVKSEYGADPALTMSPDEDPTVTNNTITIDCGNGVVLGATQSEATEFWFCIPPVTFSQGFTITVTDVDDEVITKSSDVSRTITRSTMNSMEPFQYVKQVAQNLSFANPTVVWVLGEGKVKEGSYSTQAVSGSMTTVQFTSSDESVVEPNSGGGLTIKGEGTATITATAVASEEYLAGSASYTLVVTGAVQLWENGPKWATVNVGASSPADAGGYFVWGGTTADEYSSIDDYFDNPSHDHVTFVKYFNGTGGKTVLDPEDDAARVNWGGNWRMPTKDELAPIVYSSIYCTKSYVEDYNGTGKSGFLVSGLGDYSGNSIFFPLTGSKNGGSYYSLNTVQIWSTSLDTEGPNDDKAYYIVLSNPADGGHSSLFGYRFVARVVRPVID